MWQEKNFPGIYKEKILKANPDMKTSIEKMKWKWWESNFCLSKEGKEIRRLDKFTKETTKLEFLDFFIQDIQELSLHLFNWRWHDQQFDYIKENLQVGMLLQVLDFAQNYMNKYQDEPKECHWDHSQTVLHPIINHRRCPSDGKLIVEEHVIISDDLNHNKHAVKAFEEASMKELEKSGFTPSHVMQLCDNCSSQYKSKGPFQYIANADIPTIRSYFGSNHGKGPTDSATGRVKSAIIRAQNARVSELKNAQEVFEFLQQKFQQWEERRIRQSDGKCIHFFQKAFFVTDIDRTEEISAVTTTGSSNFSTVRSTGIPFIVEARNIACLCPNCLFGDTCACPNKHYSGTWTRYNLHTGKKVTDPEFCNKHWCANEACTEGSDVENSLQLQSVSSNIQSCSTSP